MQRLGAWLAGLRSVRLDGRYGMATFSLIWLGQVVSMVGSGLTEFGLGVWVFQRTGAATDYALIALCISLPQVLVAPLAGAIVDRSDRRRVMLLADCGAALSTLVVAALAWSGQLEPWHVYAAVLATSTCAAIQFPAYAALMTRLVPEEHLGRANGMVEMAWSGSLIVAPLIAAALISWVSLPGLLLVDLATFCVGVLTLMLARIPGGARPEPARAASHQRTGVAAELREGWRFITARSGLPGLLVFSALVSLSAGTFNALFAPMILSNESASALGGLASAGGCGMLAGGLVLTAWGGPRRRLHGVCGASIALGLAMVAIGLYPAWIVMALAVGLYFGALPFVNGCEQTIWQTATPDGLQGRVLAVRRAVEHGAAMLAYLAAGPLADRVFEPLLASTGGLASGVGVWIGVGPGRGIGLLLIVMGLLAAVTALAALLSQRLRSLEDEGESSALRVGSPVLEPAA